MTENNPDLKRDFTRIPNQLIEAFAKLKLGEHEWSVVWVVIRKTYGWNKRWDRISNSQISKATGLDKRHASRAVKNLFDKKVLLIDDMRRISVNGDTEKWETSRQALVPREAPSGWGSPRGTVGVPQKVRGSAGGDDNLVPLKAQREVPREAPQNTHSNTGKDTNIKDKRKNNSGEGMKAARRANGKTPPLTAATWEAYAAAYQERYGVEPLRNATVNGQLAQFVKRVGKDLAPLVAAYYVTLNTRWYVAKGHSVGIMLADAEKLATESRTRRPVTETDARKADESQARLGVFQRLLEKHRAEHER